MTPKTRPPKVAVCIITLHRPEGLWALLEGLAAQRFAATPPEVAPDVTIVVTDNDAERSAESVALRAREELGLTVEYHVEPRRGFATARNRSTRVVKDRVDFCALIDDDEVPEPDWLEHLLATRERFDADVVAGPVVPVFEEPPPRWAVEGRFFERPGRPTGTSLPTCGGGNTLVRSELFDTLRFDEAFGASGGEDTDFFLRAGRRGATIVWCAEAVAHETVSPERVSVGWLLRRAYGDGNSYAFCEASLDPGLGTRLTRLLKGVGRSGSGLARLVLGLGSRVRRIAAAVAVCRGAGMVSGALGRRYEGSRAPRDPHSRREEASP